MVASSPVWSPIMRPALPRASSAMSGFFFYGIIDEPVAKPSCRVTKLNSAVFQIKISSAMREIFSAIKVAMKENSASWSRAAVASIELGSTFLNPSSFATSCASSPSEEPARAPPRRDCRRCVLPNAPGAPGHAPAYLSQVKLLGKGPYRS